MSAADRRREVLLRHLRPDADVAAAAAPAAPSSGVLCAEVAASASPVSASLRGDGVLLLTINYPPVNSLHPVVLQGLVEAYEGAAKNDAVKAVVITGVDKTFVAGADIGFMQQNGIASAQLFAQASERMQALENGPKPVVAAVNGTALGGGLELAMLCSHRVVVPNAQLGLPELKLGLIPGLGGTQRLPRLVGLQKGLEMMLQSRIIKGSDAVQAGLADAVAEPATVVETAVRLALDIAAGRVARTFVLRKTDVLAKEADMVDGILQFARAAAGKTGLKFPLLCIDAIESGLKNGGEKGLLEEQRKFAEAMQLPTAAALMHVFFAERATGKVPGVTDKNVTPRALRKVGVLGGGLMGSGIATALLSNGFEVWLKEINQEFLDGGVKRVRDNFARYVKSNKMTEQAVQAALARLHPVLTYDEFGQLDMVIEAVIEKIELKQSVFQDLERACSKTCILATNTSTIDIDVVGAKTQAADRIVGLHFFSPAHIMPLVEIIRTSRVSVQVLADSLDLVKRIRKTPIVVGNCVGFTVNRIFFPYGQAADLLTDHGVDPYRTDKALMKFGMPMGVYRLNDMVGGDVVAFVGENVLKAYGDRVYQSAIRKLLIEAKRFGEKTGKGFYAHVGGKPQPDAELGALLAKSRQAAGNPAPAEISDDEIVEVILFPVINEATRVIEEGHVNRASDIDIATIMGYGFPPVRGGLLHWADAVFGSKYVHDKLVAFGKRFGQVNFFRPSAFLASRAGSNAPLSAAAAAAAVPASAGAGAARCPHAGIAAVPRGSLGAVGKRCDQDVVIVSAVRTALGKAKRGGFKDTAPEDLVLPLLQHILRTTPGLKATDVDDVVIGSVLPRGDGAILAFRAATLLAGLPNEVPVRHVNRLCSSGLQAVADVAAAIHAGMIECGIAGGVESMSRNAMGQDVTINEAAIGTPVADVYLPMGMTSENVSDRFSIPRAAQDAFAAESHRRAVAAIKSGKFKDEIVPVKTKVVDAKTNETKEITVSWMRVARDGTTAEQLGKLPPAFRQDGKSTAGNSSQLTDGAACVLLMSRRKAAALGLPVMGVLRSYAVVGVEPGVMGVGPAYAIPRAAEMAGVSLADVDLFEVNEAFASQALYCVDKLGLSKDKVNVNGGAIALGHPLGCTGARQVATLLHEMKRRRARLGVISMCIGTGMGAAAVFEAEH